MGTAKKKFGSRNDFFFSKNKKNFLKIENNSKKGPNSKMGLFFRKANRNSNIEFLLKSILVHSFEMPVYISISLTVSS